MEQKNEKKVKVLQVAYDLTMGGVPADIMYPARLLNKKDVEFDVLLTSDTEGFYDEEFLKYGDIYRIPDKVGSNKFIRGLQVFTNPIRMYFRVKRFLQDKKGYYDCIHCRNFEYNAPCVAAAHKVNIPIRIAHSHVSFPAHERFHKALYHRISQKIIQRHATICLGVTEGALKYMIGDGKGYVIKNPTVNLSKFDPHKYEYSDHNEIHLIMVGSIEERKNQLFGAAVLKELLFMDQQAHLTFIGYSIHPEDRYLEKVQDYIKNNNLENQVVFLPKDSDVAKALAESDIMLIPSLQEGLPNVALEAQAMGVHCFVSTDVERICDCGLCDFLSLSDGPSKWAKAVIKFAETSKLKKTFIDMSSWDNKKVSEFHLRIWRGENPYES